MFSILTGCADLNRNLCAGPNSFCPGPSRLEMDYGTSYKLAKFNQTLNPDAEKNLEPVTGFDGVAAQATMGRYHKSFEEKSTAPVYSINLGTIR